MAAQRERFPDLILQPAPGFDEYLPHDLVHFFVERHWRLRHGIYGQLADGGDAGTFRPADQTWNRKWARQAARRQADASDVGRSEALAGLAHIRWYHDARGARLPDYTNRLADSAAITASEWIRARDELSEIAQCWHALKQGESIDFEWPWPERRAGRSG